MSSPANSPQSAGNAPASPSAAAPRRRGRKVVITLLVLVVLLLLLVGALPSLLSTGPGKNLALSFANARLTGVLQLDGLSLSWLGPTRLTRLRVIDAAQREVVNVGQVTAARGLFGLLTGAADFGELRIESPRAVVYIGKDNSVSLLEAFQPRQPSPSASGPLPEPRGHIVLSGGAVRAVRENAPAYEVTDLAGDIDLQTLGQLKGKLAAKLPDGATLAADADLRNLVTQGELRPAGAAGKLTLASDRAFQLGPLMRVLSPEHPVNGATTVSVQASGEGGELAVKGHGGIDDLSVGTGEQALREKKVDFDLDATINQAQQRLSLTRARLSSAALTAEISGTVSEFSGARVCALRGRYDAAWTSLTNLLHELVPATARLITFEGTSTSAFELTGPLRTVGAQPPFRGGKAGLDLNWSAARLYGVGLGAAKLSPALHDGQVTIPPARIPAGDGQMNVAGIIDLQPADPTLRIAESLQVFDRVALTPELASSLLSWINPLFLNLAQIEGRINLKAAGVELPLSAAIEKRGQATGQLDLQNVRLQPAGWASEVAELTGLPTQNLMPVQFGQLDFNVRDGRIRYDNFTATFPEHVDLKFSGSVGFDGSLDLVLSIPVRAGLLRRLGVEGPALDLVQSMSDVRIEIPLIGTRDQPRLDLAKVDKQKLVQQLIGGESPEKRIEGLLKGLGGEKSEEESKPKKP